MKGAGTIIITLGLVLVAIGLLTRVGALRWFGRLPGDIHIRGEHTHVFIPLTSMVLTSLVLSLLLYIARRWL